MEAVQRDLNDLTSKVPLVKLKKQKTSQRTYRRKALPSNSADKDNRRAESEKSDHTNLGNVSVMKLQKKKGGARVYSKKHYCLYCPMHFHKMARHLIHKHSNETAVAQAITFPFELKGTKSAF